MTIKYLMKRLALFIITVFVAATINFLIPRITPQDPIAALMGRLAGRGQTIENGDELIARYKEEFGLNDPLPIQYLKYLEKLFTKGDMGYSLSYFPTKVTAIIGRAIPWTLGLLIVANILAFILGNLLGALCAWGRMPGFLKKMIYFSISFSVIPYYILALLLLYVFSILIPILPMGGISTVGSTGGTNIKSLLDLAWHAILPILSVVISLTGFWILSMRGVMTSVIGEDYLLYAKARGLKRARIFIQYALRNAVLPQVTAFGIDVGRIISGAVLVEIIFGYPGVGTVLYNALRTADYFVIQGVIMFIIISVALTNLIIDLIYPILDPRIKYN